MQKKSHIEETFQMHPSKQGQALHTSSDEVDEEKRQKFGNGKIYSVKNLHEMEKIFFNRGTLIKTNENKKQSNIQRLKEEKLKLEESLEILRNGAVSALIEKDEIIEKLKKMFERNKTNQTDQESQQNDDKNKLQSLLAYMKDIEEDREYLKVELQNEKNYFQKELEYKEEIIEELVNEINILTQKNTTIERQNLFLSEKIQIIHIENENLSFLFNKSQEILKDNQKQTSKFTDNKSEELLKTNTSFYAPFNSSESVEKIDFNEAELEDKIEKIRLQYETQIFQLKKFYENQIQLLKKTFVEEQSEIKDEKSVISQTSCRKYRSNTVSKSKDTSSNVNIEKMLTKKLSYASIRSNEIMETIYEKDETIKERKNLKRDYSFLKRFQDNTLYEKSNFKSQLRRNFDVESDVTSEKSSQISDDEKESDFPLPVKDEEIGRNSWQNLIWFSLGSFFGGSLISIASRLIKR